MTVPPKAGGRMKNSNVEQIFEQHAANTSHDWVMTRQDVTWLGYTWKEGWRNSSLPMQSAIDDLEKEYNSHTPPCIPRSFVFSQRQTGLLQLFIAAMA